ncbi:hypothetical protein Cni_G25494 [Canna indica]|uniref:Rubredoxin-like domain-containing protein n=1 Tax=Canna indica TaxID=4628 RepID=A0AAQ3L1Y7_9LILI|nr:hypothetical protein Cni_G25494 [Canna indica]
MMASATARLAFPFHHFHSFHSYKPPKTTLPLLTRAFTPFPRSPSTNLHFVISSVDVSKEDKPLSSQPDDEIESSSLMEPPSPEENQQQLDPRRLEEKFAVLNIGIYECRSCGYRYNEAAGDPSYPIPPGFPFEKLPDDWRCPTCGAAQSFFQSKSVEIAGFAQNQQFGLGGNSLTSGQKTLLIYGSLLLGFLFFISGYFLQLTNGIQIEFRGLWTCQGLQLSQAAVSDSGAARFDYLIDTWWAGHFVEQLCVASFLSHFRSYSCSDF